RQKVSAPTLTARPSERPAQPCSDTTSCSSFPANPNFSRLTTASGFLNQLDARIGPKAAATEPTASTVRFYCPTLGDCPPECQVTKGAHVWSLNSHVLLRSLAREPPPYPLA